MSRSTPSRVNFVIRRESRVGIGSFVATVHPWYPEAVLMMRVHNIYSVNEEMDVGRTAVMASSLGVNSDFQNDLEYLIAECEVLGYKIPGSNKLYKLEAPPSTSSPVFLPDKEMVNEFFRYGRQSLGVVVGRIKGTDVLFSMDLDGIARGHLFISGMTRSGKSVSGDTLVVIFDADVRTVEILRIDEFYRRMAGDSGRDLVTLDSSCYYTVAMDFRSMTPVWMPIRAVIRHEPAEEIYEVITKNGRRIKLTEGHGIYVWDGRRIKLTGPEKLKRGNFWVFVPRKILIPSKRKMDPAKAELLGAAVADGIAKDECITIYSEDLSELELMAEAAGVSYSRLSGGIEIYDSEMTELVRGGFLSLAGLSNERVEYGDIRLGSPRSRALKEFFDRTSWIVDNGSGEHPVFRRFYSSSRRRSMEVSVALNLLGVPTFNHVWDGFYIHEPSLLLLTENVAASGHIPARTIPTVVLNKCRKLKPYFGRLVQRKRVLQEILRQVKDAYIDPIKGEGITLREYIGILTSELDVDEVVEVRKVKYNDYVYDLSVFSCENFLANGIFVHNSTFSMNLILKSLRLNVRPKFLVLDRRGEYEGLTKNKAAVMYDYRRFVPVSGFLKPEDVARMLKISPGTSLWRIVVLAAEDIVSKGFPVNRDNLLSEVSTLLNELGSKDRIQKIREIKARLRRFGHRIERERGEGRDILDALSSSDVVILDYSLDTNYEDQFLATRNMIRDLLRRAVESRREGNFALIVLVEEAQYFIPEKGAPVVGDPHSSGVAQAFVEAISQSGGYNLGFVVVSQRPAYLSKSVISQCNTIASFRLRNGNDQEAIMRYTECDESMRSFLPSLDDNEAIIWGMASPIPFPVNVEMSLEVYPSKAAAPPHAAWRRMRHVDPP